MQVGGGLLLDTSIAENKDVIQLCSLDIALSGDLRIAPYSEDRSFSFPHAAILIRHNHHQGQRPFPHTRQQPLFNSCNRT